MRLICLFLSLTPVIHAEDAATPLLLSELGKVSATFRLELHKGDDLLKSVQRVIQEKKIVNGAVLTGVGNLASCRYHGIGGGVSESSESMALINLAGPIVNGKPHLHISVAPKSGASNAGHLEPGCIVMTRVDVILTAFAD